MKGKATQWKPGQSGNPKGRTPTPPEVREYAKLHTFEVIDRLVAIALSKRNASASVAACKELLDRAVGKSKQPVEVSGDEEHPLKHELKHAPPSPSELADVLRLLVGAGAIPDAGAALEADGDAGTEAVQVLGTPADDDSTSGTPRPK